MPAADAPTAELSARRRTRPQGVDGTPQPVLHTSGILQRLVGWGGGRLLGTAAGLAVVVLVVVADVVEGPVTAYVGVLVAAPLLAADLTAVARAVSEATAREVDLEDFVTAIFVEFDVDGRGHMIRCGHPAPLRLTAAGVEEVETTLDQPPLGLVVDAVAEPLVLAPGERLLLFTDGFTEARDLTGAFLHPVAAANGLALHGLDAALDVLLATVDAHTGGGQRDDLALLLVEHDLRRAPRSTTAPGDRPAHNGVHPAA